MIEIKCVDEVNAAVICRHLGVPVGDVFEMVDGQEVLGRAVANREGTQVILVFLEAPGPSFTDALLRAVLNAERAKGATVAKIISASLLEHVQTKNYIVDNFEKTLNIADFFAKSVCKD